MLFTRVRFKYKDNTFDATNFHSFSATSQRYYEESKEDEQPLVLMIMFRSALFGADQMVFDTYSQKEKMSLAEQWRLMSNKIADNKEEPNVIY